MSDRKNNIEKDDGFWDLSADIERPKRSHPSYKNIDTVEIIDGEDIARQNKNRLTDDSTVIKRYIPPHTADANSETELNAVCAYSPNNSLIHRVTLYKASSTYNFYEKFCDMAAKLWNRAGEPCEYQDFFSYSPQYDQLNAKQLSYYLWWRENIRNGVYIKTNFCYINLYFYELINTDGIISDVDARKSMIDVVTNYSDLLRGAISKYMKWICDYSLIRKLSAPRDIDLKLLNNTSVLKEYFVNVKGDTPEGWAEILLKYCCSYDYKTSKFANGEALVLYDTHVKGALAACVEYLSGNGGILSDIPFGDCKIKSKAFDGAICSAANRYTIEVEYCSFSRSHELRFLVGDIVKYCENKIRAYISVKSRLTVYSLTNELKEVVDRYFEKTLPPSARMCRKKTEKHDYDALYELSSNTLDLTNAARIELESWDTTRELVEAFEEENDGYAELVETVEPSNDEVDTETDNSFGKYRFLLARLAEGDQTALTQSARDNNIPLDALVDKINEIAVDIIGDVIIEDINGRYCVIEDYIDEIK